MRIQCDWRFKGIAVNRMLEKKSSLNSAVRYDNYAQILKHYKILNEYD